jgi:hypothetical protein
MPSPQAMAASPPPDLRVLCRKLTSLPPADLPRALPSLTNHIIRCKPQLSVAHDPKSKDKNSEVATLVHKLKTSITTLLTSRTIEGRFAAVALVKAVVDIGGWEVWRSTEPWARGLLAIIQVSADNTLIIGTWSSNSSRRRMILQPRKSLQLLPLQDYMSCFSRTRHSFARLPRLRSRPLRPLAFSSSNLRVRICPHPSL